MPPRCNCGSPLIAPSLKQLHAENRATNRSLGIIRPEPGSVKFIVKPAKDADAEDRQIADQVLQAQQGSLLEDPLTPLEKPEFAFIYRYMSEGRHEHMIHDWEVQAAYRQYKRRYGEAALDHLKRMYGETIPARNLHFIMGTMAAHPRTFIVIGLLRSGLDSAELGKWGKLPCQSLRRGQLQLDFDKLSLFALIRFELSIASASRPLAPRFNFSRIFHCSFYFRQKYRRLHQLIDVVFPIDASSL